MSPGRSTHRWCTIALTLIAVTTLCVPLAHAACTPVITDTGVTVNPAVLSAMSLVFTEPTKSAYLLLTASLYRFDYTTLAGSVTTHLIAGTGSKATYSSNEVYGYSSTFDGYGGIVNSGATAYYLIDVATVVHVALAGTFSTTGIAGDGSIAAPPSAWIEGTGLLSRFSASADPAWTSDAEDAFFLPGVASCRIVRVAVAAPYELKFVAGDGVQSNIAGFGLSARLFEPKTIARFRDRYYVGTGNRAVLIMVPQNSYFIGIVQAEGQPQSTGASASMGASYGALGAGRGSFGKLWSNCWLSFHDEGTLYTYIWSPDAGPEMHLVTGVSLSLNRGYSRDPAGNLWASDYSVAGTVKKFTIAYTGCGTNPTTCGDSKTMTRSLDLPTPVPLGPGATAVPPTPAPPSPAPPTPAPPSPAPPTPAPPSPAPPTPAPGPGATAVPPTPLPPGATAVPPTPLPPGATAVPPTPLPPGATAVPPTPLPPGATAGGSSMSSTTGSSNFNTAASNGAGTDLLGALIAVCAALTICLLI